MKSNQWDSSWPAFASPDFRVSTLEFWERRFGVPPSVFAPYELASSSRVTYLIRKNVLLPGLSSMRITRAGLPFMKNAGRHRKPTTEAAQLFGHLATRNVVKLDLPDLATLCLRNETTLKLDTEPGFVFLMDLNNSVWGCGLYLEPGRLLNRLPKRMVQELIQGKRNHHIAPQH